MPGHISFRDRLNAFGLSVQANALAMSAKLKSDRASMSPNQQAAFDHVYGSGGRGLVGYGDAKEHLAAQMRDRREFEFPDYAQARSFLDLFDPQQRTGMVAASATEWQTYLRAGGITDRDLQAAYAGGNDVLFIMRNSNTAELKRIERYTETGKTKSASKDVQKAITKNAVQQGQSKADARREGKSATRKVARWQIIWSAAGG